MLLADAAFTFHVTKRLLGFLSVRDSLSEKYLNRAVERFEALRGSDVYTNTDREHLTGLAQQFKKESTRRLKKAEKLIAQLEDERGSWYDSPAHMIVVKVMVRFTCSALLLILVQQWYWGNITIVIIFLSLIHYPLINKALLMSYMVLTAICNTLVDWGRAFYCSFASRALVSTHKKGSPTLLFRVIRFFK
jgi:hypothetical protein